MFFPVHGKRHIKRTKHLGLVSGIDGLPSNDRDGIVKYFLYMYDKGSPLPSKIIDLNERKQAAADLAKIPKSDTTLREKLFSLTDSRYREIVHSILRVQNHRLWQQLVSNEQYFYELQERMLEPVEESRDDKQDIDAIEKKFRLSQISEEIDEKLTRMYELYYGDSAEELATDDRIMWTPEGIADV